LLDVQGDEVPDPDDGPDGSAIYRWTDIADIVDFGFYATADLATITEDTYAESRSETEVGDRRIVVVVQAWADDRAWGRATARSMTRALPILHELIGVNYFGTRNLTVVETVSRSIGGYAGTFDDRYAEDEIRVAFDADEATILHEAAHAWFNYTLTSDRWIVEGFASHYGTLAARRMDVEPFVFHLDRQLRRSAYPLAEWDGGQMGREELFGYAASQVVAGELADRAGDEGLAMTFAAMLADEAAYQPLHADNAEASYSHPSNWRYLLDMLEERTDATYDDILREWVVPRSQHDRLDDRTAARESYATLVDLLSDWDVPTSLRREMNAWDFDAAGASMEQANALLERRAVLDARAASLGAEPPLDEVQGRFENGEIARANQAIGTIDNTLSSYEAALVASRDGVDPIEWIGLFGADPSADLAAAVAAIGEGEWEDAVGRADAARTTWEHAASEGTTRAAVGGGAVAVLLLGSGAVVWRRSARRKARVAAAHIVGAPRDGCVTPSLMTSQGDVGDLETMKAE
jgi:hypothetical protein